LFSLLPVERLTSHRTTAADHCDGEDDSLELDLMLIVGGILGASRYAHWVTGRGYEFLGQALACDA
jgi:hypothetical protein